MSPPGMSWVGGPGDGEDGEGTETVDTVGNVVGGVEKVDGGTVGPSVGRVLYPPEWDRIHHRASNCRNIKPPVIYYLV